MSIMWIGNKLEAIVLFFGDVALLYAALFATLSLRYFELPTNNIINLHLLPFSILFIVWLLTFYIAGLYEKHTLLFRKRLLMLVFQTQVTNSIVAVLFFYFTPFFEITPKTNLFIYLAVSFFFILAWRLSVLAIGVNGKREKAMIIGSGKEMRELESEVNNNPRYRMVFVRSIDVEKENEADFINEIMNMIHTASIMTIVIDLKHKKVEPLLPHLYNLLFLKIQFIDEYKMYEEVFDRVPLSLLRNNWFLENISSKPYIVNDILKRVMDITLSLFAGIISLALYPVVFLAIKLNDGGKIFTFQDRVGQDNKIIRLLKFRTMLFDDQGQWGAKNKTENRVTRVGKFLRKTRIDELPQLWNVLKGDISLIGPRPEFQKPVAVYIEKIPFYNLRHIIKPGLSGWAQVYHDQAPHHEADVDATRTKLSYDLYYIKNRSFLLDIKIALRTIQILLSRKGI